LRDTDYALSLYWKNEEYRHFCISRFLSVGYVCSDAIQPFHIWYYPAMYFEELKFLVNKYLVYKSSVLDHSNYDNFDSLELLPDVDTFNTARKCGNYSAYLELLNKAKSCGKFYFVIDIENSLILESPIEIPINEVNTEFDFDIGVYFNWF
jgi:hypothetical protein